MTVRPRRPRLPIVRAVVLGVVALGVLLGWDASRQPTAGGDWLLVGRQRGVGPPNRIVALNDPTQFAAAWRAMHLVGEPTPIDFDRDLVFWFTSVGTVGCPSRFDGLRIDFSGRRVEASFSRGFTLGCDDGAVPDSFLVSVDRDRLPAVGYEVRLLGPQPAGAINGTLQIAP